MLDQNFDLVTKNLPEMNDLLGKICLSPLRIFVLNASLYTRA